MDCVGDIAWKLMDNANGGSFGFRIWEPETEMYSKVKEAARRCSKCAEKIWEEGTRKMRIG
jgi:hypothetical protein